MTLSLERMRAILASDLTARALEGMKPGGSLADTRNPGFRARRQGTGQPALELRYRHAGKRRTVKLGQYRRHPDDARVMGPPKTVRDALERYHAILDTLDAGEDPQAKPAPNSLRPALDAYEQSIAKRQVVKRGEVMSLLRREMLGPLGNVALASLTRAALVKRIEAIEAGGRPGTARELRTRAGVFLNFCVDQGLLAANPLAGWRRERRTRAQRLEEHGRALADWEWPILWRAACEAKAPLGAWLLVRLLTGQRRSETVAMRWADVDLGRGVWTIRAEVGKTRPLFVPLPRLVRVILRSLPRRGELVFAGRGGRPMTGWSKRLVPVYEATAAAGMGEWMPGDLRKTFRTGVEELGVPVKVCELMIGHGPKDSLERTYSRAERWPERRAAARRWALHVMGVVRATKLQALGSQASTSARAA